MLSNFCDVLIFVDVQCGLFLCMFDVIEYIVCNLFNAREGPWLEIKSILFFISEIYPENSVE